MSFLYPRTLTIERPAAQTGAGKLGYGGLTKAARTSVASGIPAGVQAKGSGRHGDAGLPADTRRAEWVVMIPLGQVPPGDIRNHDVITDDLGRVFTVTSDFCDSMGWALTCEREEV